MKTTSLLPIALGLFGGCLLAGCETLEALGVSEPDARIKGLELQNLSLQAVDVLFDVEVSNPYQVDLPLVDLDFRLARSGREFLSGKTELDGAVPAGARRVVPVPVTVPFVELLDVLKGVRPGAVIPFDAELGLSVDTPLAGALRFPLRKSGELPIPSIPKVRVASIDWKKLALTGVEGELNLEIANTNQFPVDVQRFAYELSIGSNSIFQSQLESKPSFEGGQKRTLSIPMSLSTLKLGAGVLQILRGDGAEYQLLGDLDIGTPFGPLAFPVESVGRTLFRGS